jgi:hypothetical protein
VLLGAAGNAVLAAAAPVFVGQAFGGLDREAYDREYSDRELVRRIWQYLRPHRDRVVWLPFLIALIALAGDTCGFSRHGGTDGPGGHYAEIYDTYFRHQSLGYIKRVGERRRQVAERDG